MSIIGRLRQSFTLKGFWSTLGHTACSLLNCWRLLTFEPALPLCGIPPRNDFDAQQTRIAVHIHMFYLTQMDEMIRYTNAIPYRFDCYISTDSSEKAEIISKRFGGESRASNIEVKVYPNQGRDVAPFLQQFAPHISEYDFCCHLHTKSSMHNGFGEHWRLYLLDSLLASPSYVAAIMQQFDEQSQLGLVYQRTYRSLKPYLGWHGNYAMAVTLFKRMKLCRPSHKAPKFPAGSMFWARTKAIAPIFECGLKTEDFEAENGQLEGTLAHCIERCWGCLVQEKGYALLRVYGVDKR